MKTFCAFVLLFSMTIISYGQLDSSVNYGKLPNGLTYYVTKNKQPSNQLFISLVVRAGSALEEEDQRGLAHFVEHMAYNGTTHFPGNNLVDYIQKKGLTHGKNSNANTGPERTVYYFKIPSNDSLLIDSCILALKEFAREMTMDSLEIDAERGVIIGEMNMSHKLKDTRLRKQYLPIISNHSRYADRPSIGTEYNLKHFQHASLKRFYLDWYRPDLMAIIAAGDLDTGLFRNKIAQVFGSIKSVESAKRWQDFPSKLDNQNKYVIATDTEQEDIEVVIYNKFIRPELTTKNGLKDEMLASLYTEMMQRRMSTLMETFKGQMLSAYSNIQPIQYQGHLFAVHSGFKSKVSSFKNDFKSVYRELVRIRHFGFTVAELKQAKSIVRKTLQKQYSDNTENIVHGLTNHFVFGRIFPGCQRLCYMMDSVLDIIDVQTFNLTVKDWIASTNRDIVLMANGNISDKLPNQKQINEWISEVDNEKISPFTYTKIPDYIFDKNSFRIGPEGIVTSHINYTKIDADENIFSNGMRVIFKQIPAANGKIDLKAYSKGGTSIYPEIDSLTRANLPLVMADLGVGTVDKFQLKKYLDASAISLTPEIQKYYEGLSGTAEASHLEEMIQLICLYFSESTYSQLAAESRLKMSGNISPQLFKKSMYEGFKIFKQRFSTPAAFTFVLVGDFNRDSALNYFKKYLSVFPGKSELQEVIYSHLNKEKTTISYAGAEDVATVSIVYDGQVARDQKNAVYINAITDIIANRCFSRLREKEGLAYSPLVYGDFFGFPAPNFTISIGAYCSADSVDRLINAVFDEISQLTKVGPDHFELQKTKIKLLAENNRIITSSDLFMWSYYLVQQLKGNGDLEEVVNSDLLIDQLTTQELQQLARKILIDENVFKLITYPVKFKM